MCGLTLLVALYQAAAVGSLPSSTSVCGLTLLLVYAAFSYCGFLLYLSTSVCGLTLLVYAAFSYCGFLLHLSPRTLLSILFFSILEIGVYGALSYQYAALSY